MGVVIMFTLTLKQTIDITFRFLLLLLFLKINSFYCISSDSSDLSDMTVECIDSSVPHTSCFSLHQFRKVTVLRLVFPQIYRIIYNFNDPFQIDISH